MADSPRILALIGPTASGKSALALALAGQISADLLSVDSMQVYRGMNIGTAKPSSAERAQIRHHLIDVVAPNETFTVARFVDGADQVIAESAAAGIPLVATGGTPLYFKALFEGLFEGPSADDAVRERLRQLSNDELSRRLREVDPPAAARIHLNDTRRLIRALEVFELTGKPISSFQTDWESGKPRHQAMWFGLEWDRHVLNHRINARVRAMIASGWLEETRGLLAEHGALSPTAAEATGYRQLADHLAGRLSLEDAIEQIKIATRQLARRQMKWLRRFRNVTWLGGDRSLDELASEVLTRWGRGSQ